MSQPSAAAGALLSIASLFTVDDDPELRDVRLAMEPVRANAVTRDEALRHATPDEAAGLQRMLDRRLLVID